MTDTVAGKISGVDVYFSVDSSTACYRYARAEDESFQKSSDEFDEKNSNLTDAGSCMTYSDV
jgi:hypothetical protein